MALAPGLRLGPSLRIALGGGVDRPSRRIRLWPRRIRPSRAATYALLINGGGSPG